MRNSTTDNLFEEEVLSHWVDLKKAQKVSVVLILLYILGLIWSYKTSVEIFYLYLVFSCLLYCLQELPDFQGKG